MDESRPNAEAVLVRANRISAAGPLAAVLQRASADAVSTDLRGRTLTGMSKQQILEKLKEHEKTFEPSDILAGVRLGLH